MTMQLNREAGGDQDLALHYWKADSRAIRMVLPLLFGVFAVIPLWLLFLCVNQLRILAGLGSSYLMSCSWSLILRHRGKWSGAALPCFPSPCCSVG